MRTSRKIIAGVAAAILAVAVAGLAWWILRDEGPEAVDLEAAVALMETVDITDGGDTTPATGPTQDIGTTLSTAPDTPATTSNPTMSTGDAPTTTSTIGTGTSVTTSTTPPTAEDPTTTSTTSAETSVATSGAVEADDAVSPDPGEVTETTAVDLGMAALSGVWTIVTTEGADVLTAESPVSFAGYRVVEVLAGGVDESTAVGRTAEVTGSIELSATQLVAATVVVEMATLRTDDSHRDSHARQELHTSEFPLAVFTLVEPLDLPEGVSEGEKFSGSAVGDLTIKGVTNRAVFDLEAQLVGDTIVAVGSTGVVFADFGVATPTSRAVISVEDHGIMEFQLFFTR